MTRKLSILATVLAAALQAAPAHAVVPQVMTYSGYLKTSGGVAVTAPTNLSFRLYTAASGGTPVWTETLSATPSSDGWFSVVLGTTAALPFASLGGDLYLGIEVATEGEFPQRARLTPSHAAITVDWSGIGNKPGTCGAGQFLTGIDASGTALCATPAGGGTGGVASVTGSGPISATGATAVTVSLTGCSAANQILQWNGTSWGCINTPAPGAGGVTQVQATSPLIVTGTTANPIIGLPTICAPNQILKWNGTVWGCANDVDTVNPGTVTSVAPAGTAGNPIAVANGTGAATIDIPPASAGVSGYLRGTDFTAFAAKITAPGGCTDGQVVKWQAAPAPGAFVCAADAVNAGTVTAVTAAPPLLSSGGPTPAISLPQASAAADGYLTRGDYAAFSNKVSSVQAGLFIQTTTGTTPRVGLQPCPSNGQIPKWDSLSGSWQCAIDLDSGGTLTGVQVSGGALGLNGGLPGVPNIQLPPADPVTNGYLSFIDWSIFAGKMSPPSAPCPTGTVVTWTATGAACTPATSAVQVSAPLVDLGTANVPKVALPTCPAGQVLASNGAGWACAPMNSAFKNVSTSLFVTPAASSVTNVLALNFTAPVAGTVLVQGSGYCNVPTGVALSFHLLIGTAPTSHCNFLCLAGQPCDRSFCAIFNWPVANPQAQISYAVQRQLTVAAGSNTVYLNFSNGTADTTMTCHGSLTATFNANTLP
jgi:hypothetical protein